MTARTRSARSTRTSTRSSMSRLRASRPAVHFNFTVHGDDAPTFYLSGNPACQSAPVRDFERAAGGSRRQSLHRDTDTLMVAMADRRRDEAPAHVHGRRSAARSDVRVLRRPELLPDRLPDEHVQDVHQPGVRVEPRRHPAGDREHVARVRRAGCAAARRRRAGVDGPRRRGRRPSTPCSA